MSIIITGTVKDMFGNGINGATVSGAGGSAVTGQDGIIGGGELGGPVVGAYEYYGTQTGTRVITCTPPTGYLPKSKTVTIVQGTNTVDFIVTAGFPAP